MSVSHQITRRCPESAAHSRYLSTLARKMGAAQKPLIFPQSQRVVWMEVLRPSAWAVKG